MKIEELFEKSQTREETRRIVGRWCENNPRLKIEDFVFGHTSDVEQYKGDFLIYPNMLENGILPVKVKRCSELTLLAPVKSFLNFPDMVSSSFFGNLDNGIISSLVGLNINVGGTFYANDFKGLQLSNINKYIKSAEYIKVSSTNKGPLLSLLKVKNLKAVESVSIDNDLNNAINIINLHLSLDKDILQCQDELIENGLKEFAKL